MTRRRKGRWMLDCPRRMIDRAKPLKREYLARSNPAFSIQSHRPSTSKNVSFKYDTVENGLSFRYRWTIRCSGVRGGGEITKEEVLKTCGSGWSQHMQPIPTPSPPPPWCLQRLRHFVRSCVSPSPKFHLRHLHLPCLLKKKKKKKKKLQPTSPHSQAFMACRPPFQPFFWPSTNVKGPKGRRSQELIMRSPARIVEFLSSGTGKTTISSTTSASS